MSTLSIYSFKMRFKNMLLNDNMLEEKNDFLYLMMRNVSRYQDMKLLLFGGITKIWRGSFQQEYY